MSTLLLQGRTALVTGGASGIGRATALAFAREGALVAVADLGLAGAQATVAAINAAGGQAVAIEADVGVPDAVERMLATTIAAFGRLDCAFNNAGVNPAATGSGGQKLAEIAPESWNRMIAVNLTGVFLCLRAEIRQMLAQGGGGAIVNTASIAGHVALRNASSYVAAKHGVLGLTKTAAAEYAEAGIRVNAVSPGYVATPMTEQTVRERGDLLRARTPLGRLGRPEEIAEAVVWLCSDRASFVTGSGYPVDGGYTAI